MDTNTMPSVSSAEQKHDHIDELVAGCKSPLLSRNAKFDGFTVTSDGNTDDLNADIQKQARVENELKKLQFRNPGELVGWQGSGRGERGTQLRDGKRRSSRKVKSTVEERLYSDEGKFSDGTDLCDCLRIECAGCLAEPCEQCSSFKCSPPNNCRIGRNYTYEFVHYDGRPDLDTINPCLTAIKQFFDQR